MKAREYRLLGRVEKLAYAYGRMRDNPVECPACSNGVLPRDFTSHASRCAGREFAEPLRDPWISYAALMALGLAWGTIWEWLHTDKLRRRKRSDGAWEYSHADVRRLLEGLVKWHAQRRSARNRRNARARWVARRRPA